MLNHKVDFSQWHVSDLEPGGYRPESASFHSTILELVFSSLQRTKSSSILHFGRISPGFIELVSEIRSRLITLEPETADGNSLLDYLSTSSRNFNAIFLWDHLLHLDQNQTDKVFSILNNSSKMGTSLVFLASTRSSVPDKSSKFTLRKNYQIEMIPTSSHTTTFEILDIRKRFPNWRCVRATQLRNGFREYLLVKT